MNYYETTFLKSFKDTCFWLFVVAIAICMAVLLKGCANDPAWADEVPQIEGHNINQWVEAIHKAEGNDNYGILSVSCESKEACRRICKNTVRNNYKRWLRSDRSISFLSFLQHRYCPVNASNDNGTNQYWAKNVAYFLRRQNA